MDCNTALARPRNRVPPTDAALAAAARADLECRQSPAADAHMATKTKKRAAKTGEGSGKRDEVLKIACEYFLSHGYHGASINAMARDSGISKESIYRYFDGKEELFKAVIGHELELYQSRIDTVNSY